MGLKEVISDPRFQSADPEKQAALLQRLGASDEFINKFIELGVRKGTDEIGGPGDKTVYSDLHKNADPYARGLASELEGSGFGPLNEAQKSLVITPGAMMLGGEALSPFVGPKTLGAVVGGGSAALHGKGLSSILGEAAIGALGGGVFGKLSKLHKALKAAGLDKAAPELAEAAPAMASTAKAAAPLAAEVGPEVTIANDLVKGGMPRDAAEAVARNMVKNGLMPDVVDKVKTTAAPLARAATAEAAPAATLAERQAKLLAGEANPFASTAPQYHKGARLTEEQIKDMLAEMGHGVVGP